MTHPRLVLVVFALAVVSIGASAAYFDDNEWSAEKSSAPPHVAPPAAEVPDSLGVERTPYVTPFDQELRAEVEAVAAYLAAEHERKERERAEAEEAARLAAIEQAARSRAVAPRGPSVAVECGNTVLPDHIVQRESSGRCDAYNATGCGGRGCAGYAQIDQGHFAEQSPWNPDVPGTCYGLSYNECVERLWAGGAGAGHWR